MRDKRVPVLLTWDVDPDRWTTLEKRKYSLNKTMDICEEQGAGATFFFTANFIHEYPEELERMRAFGHEVGCHGLTHTDEEEYNRMPEPMQREYIQEGVKKIKAVVDEPLTSFRGPRVKTSACTIAPFVPSGLTLLVQISSTRGGYSRHAGLITLIRQMLSSKGICLSGKCQFRRWLRPLSPML
jgi:peptidoglycan/xylan/chitin deacetylase (PgdA/CDA1 family)